MKVAIVGLPNAGKTSLFNFLSRNEAHTDIYPFTTIERNVGIWEIPDKRIERLKQKFSPEIITSSRIEIVDVAGLVKGASKGEGLGNRFLASIRDCDLILHLLRDFKGDIPHVEGSVAPFRDKEVVEVELMLADSEIVERMLNKLKFSFEESELERKKILRKIKEQIEKIEKPAITEEERKKLKGSGLISIKPFIYVVNVDEYKAEYNKEDTVEINVSLENELKDIEEKDEMRKAYGFSHDPVDKLAEKVKEKLNLITFYTVKGKETRGYLVKSDTEIIEAVRKIHSDMAKGFIKAEVIHFEDVDKNISPLIAGKNYKVRDGDIITVKFRT